MNKIICIVLVLLIVSVTACNETNKLNRIPCIKSLQSEISKSWILSNDNLYYLVNQEFLNKLGINYKNCLVGLSSDQIISLFGIPSDTKGSKNSNLISALVYRVSPPCDNKDRDTQCTEYLFYLVSHGNVRDLNYITMLGISSH